TLDPAWPEAPQPHAEVRNEDALLARGLRSLRFPGQLEKQFHEDRGPARQRYVRISGLLSLLIFNRFLVADYLLAPDVFDLAVRLRMLGCSPLALALLMWNFFGWRWVLKNTPPGFTEGFVLFSGVAAASCISYILFQSQHPDKQYYRVGMMVFLTYGNIVQRLWFRYAVAFSLIIWVMHVVGMLMVPPINARLELPAMSLVTAAAVFTLMANYAMEYDARRRYMLSRRRLRLMDELAEAQRRLHELSRVDSLTGLANRRHFQEHMHQVWQRAAHDGREVAIIILDVDHFKRYNDHYGHPAGDHCLAQV